MTTEEIQRGLSILEQLEQLNFPKAARLLAFELKQKNGGSMPTASAEVKLVWESPQDQKGARAPRKKQAAPSASSSSSSSSSSEEESLHEQENKKHGIARKKSDSGSSSSSSSSSSGAMDWIPISQMLLSRPWSSYDASNNGNNEDDAVTTRPLLQAAVSLYCRELAQMAILSSRVAFANVPRNKLEYAVEPISSWHKHVHDNVVEKPKHKQQGYSEGDGAIHSMTKAEAIEILGVDANGSSHNGLDRSTLKRSYRNLSLQCHPDRMLDATKPEQEAASQQFAKIKHAYELLISSTGANTSWYESLGGKERTDFVKFSNSDDVNGAAGQMDLISIGTGNSVLEAQDIHSAVVPLDPELVQGFVARNMQR